MALYGYARVSTVDQDCTLQEHALRAAGCEVIRAEKVSATRREGRTELALLLEFLRQGDTLVVTRIDRLACNLTENFPPITPGTPISNGVSNAKGLRYTSTARTSPARPRTTL